ncbi:hypothetical protein GMRT_11719 [Giardia muris]|uniref:Uncharacterized protein n=1 Tax=Giardia muris TaxID=5742 RepID=A0A4Z1SSV6_GIAMU|nr:hypothetical protein GMRT_11719 [Giardia muris]|eukprot:TNJ26728.1 hypothetical protein GMRT_11719 [Giardia muris]
MTENRRSPRNSLGDLLGVLPGTPAGEKNWSDHLNAFQRALEIVGRVSNIEHLPAAIQLSQRLAHGLSYTLPTGNQNKCLELILTILERQSHFDHTTLLILEPVLDFIPGVKVQTRDLPIMILKTIFKRGTAQFLIGLAFAVLRAICRCHLVENDGMTMDLLELFMGWCTSSEIGRDYVRSLLHLVELNESQHISSNGIFLLRKLPMESLHQFKTELIAVIAELIRNGGSDALRKQAFDLLITTEQAGANISYNLVIACCSALSSPDHGVQKRAADYLQPIYHTLPKTIFGLICNLLERGSQDLHFFVQDVIFSQLTSREDTAQLYLDAIIDSYPLLIGCGTLAEPLRKLISLTPNMAAMIFRTVTVTVLHGLPSLDATGKFQRTSEVGYIHAYSLASSLLEDQGLIPPAIGELQMCFTVTMDMFDGVGDRLYTMSRSVSDSCFELIIALINAFCGEMTSVGASKAFLAAAHRVLQTSVPKTSRHLLLAPLLDSRIGETPFTVFHNVVTGPVLERATSRLVRLLHEMTMETEPEIVAGALSFCKLVSEILPGAPDEVSRPFVIQYLTIVIVCLSHDVAFASQLLSIADDAKTLSPTVQDVSKELLLGATPLNSWDEQGLFVELGEKGFSETLIHLLERAYLKVEDADDRETVAATLCGLFSRPYYTPILKYYCQYVASDSSACMALFAESVRRCIEMRCIPDLFGPLVLEFLHRALRENALVPKLYELIDEFIASKGGSVFLVTSAWRISESVLSLKVDEQAYTVVSEALDIPRAIFAISSVDQLVKLFGFEFVQHLAGTTCTRPPCILPFTAIEETSSSYLCVLVDVMLLLLLQREQEVSDEHVSYQNAALACVDTVFACLLRQVTNNGFSLTLLTSLIDHSTDFIWALLMPFLLSADERNATVPRFLGEVFKRYLGASQTIYAGSSTPRVSLFLTRILQMLAASSEMSMHFIEHNPALFEAINESITVLSTSAPFTLFGAAEYVRFPPSIPPQLSRFLERWPWIFGTSGVEDNDEHLNVARVQPASLFASFLLRSLTTRQYNAFTAQRYICATVTRLLSPRREALSRRFVLRFYGTILQRTVRLMRTDMQTYRRLFDEVLRPLARYSCYHYVMHILALSGTEDCGFLYYRFIKPFFEDKVMISARTLMLVHMSIFSLGLSISNDCPQSLETIDDETLRAQLQALSLLDPRKSLTLVQMAFCSEFMHSSLHDVGSKAALEEYAIDALRTATLFLHSSELLTGTLAREVSSLDAASLGRRFHAQSAVAKHFRTVTNADTYGLLSTAQFFKMDYVVCLLHCFTSLLAAATSITAPSRALAEMIEMACGWVTILLEQIFKKLVDGSRVGSTSTVLTEVCLLLFAATGQLSLKAATESNLSSNLSELWKIEVTHSKDAEKLISLTAEKTIGVLGAIHLVEAIPKPKPAVAAFFYNWLQLSAHILRLSPVPVLTNYFVTLLKVPGMMLMLLHRDALNTVCKILPTLELEGGPLGISQLLVAGILTKQVSDLQLLEICAMVEIPTAEIQGLSSKERQRLVISTRLLLRGSLEGLVLALFLEHMSGYLPVRTSTGLLGTASKQIDGLSDTLSTLRPTDRQARLHLLEYYSLLIIIATALPHLAGAQAPSVATGLTSLAFSLLSLQRYYSEYATTGGIQEEKRDKAFISSSLLCDAIDLYNATLNEHFPTIAAKVGAQVPTTSSSFNTLQVLRRVMALLTPR